MIETVTNQIDDFIETNGDTIVISTVLMSYNSYGDESTSYTSNTTTKGLIMMNNKDLQSQGEGEVTQGTPRMLIKSTSGVALKDKITHRNVTYKVTAVKAYSNFEDTTSQPKVIELTRM
jgi:hypothetical protein